MAPTRLPADDRGSTIIEFGICVGMLMLLICSAIEFGVMFLVDSSIESAVLSASRHGVTGSSSDGIPREAAILAIIEERTMGLIDMSKADVTTKVYNSFSDIGQPEPFTDGNGNGSYDSGESFTDINGNGTWDADMGAAGLGGPGDVVVYNISYPWNAMTPLLGPFLNGTTLSAAVSVRNEPWAATP
jgi:Flp pilus assembly protein TadG